MEQSIFKELPLDLKNFIEICRINTATRKAGTGFMFDPHSTWFRF